MKRFFFKFIMMILLVSISLLGMNQAYINTNAFQTLNNTAKFENIPDNIEICNLGSSHGLRSFVYSVIEEVGFNFGLSSQDFYYDYQLLKKYSDKLKPGAVVLIVVSYFSYERDLFEEKFFTRNPRYYQILDKEYIYNFNLEDFIKYKTLPIITAEGNLKYLLKDKEHNTQDFLLKKHSIEIDRFSEDASNAVLRHTDNHGDKNVNMDYLQKIVDLCKKHSFKPILITPPYYILYNELYPKEKIADFQNTTTKFSQDNQIIFLDYSHDSRFIRDTEYFYNPDHLNYIGAKKFTVIVRNDLNELGIL